MKQFEKVRVDKQSFSTHDLSHEHKLTMNMGQLVPFMFKETLPGDKFKLNAEVLLRFQPMLAPIMHRVNAFVHYFFVPNRIIWDEWKTFITGGKSGNEMPNLPKIQDTVGNYQASSLWTESQQLPDYMGIPYHRINAMTAGNNLTLSQLPFRAYQQIYNDYYVDPAIGNEIDFPKDSIDLAVAAADAVELCTLRRRMWEKDYFTSCLPNPQLGTQVLLPLGEKAEVKLETPPAGAYQKFVKANDYTPVGLSQAISQAGTGDGYLYSNGLVGVIDPNETLYADLSDATAASINDLRRAFAMQRWMEKNARGGYRYFEQMQSHFGVKNPDATLQRAEYIGGGRMPVKVSEVLQTSETATTAQGNMTGHGFASGQNAYGKYSCGEHGFIVGIISVMPRTAYVDGVEKIWFKDDKYDFYWNDFAHIGEEEVMTKELFLEGDERDEVFGYLPRYQEYRYSADRVSGEMRDTLDFWHLGRKFAASPVLNEDFISCKPSTRIWPLEDYDQLVVQIYSSINAVRKVVKYGSPI